MFDAQFRVGLDRVTKPLGARLANWGVRPDFLTLTGLVFAAFAAVAIGAGDLLFGACLTLLAGLPDLLDGAVARSLGTDSKRGQFFDSVADRISDAMLFGALGWHLLQVDKPVAALAAVGSMAAGLIVSYERAKAEALGYRAKGGLMERGERVVGLIVALLLPVLLVALVWVIFVLSLLTVLQRFVMVWRQSTHEMSSEAGLGATGDTSRRNGEPNVFGSLLTKSQGRSPWRERRRRSERPPVIRRAKGVPRSWYGAGEGRGAHLWLGARRKDERGSTLAEAAPGRQRRRSRWDGGRFDWPDSSDT